MVGAARCSCTQYCSLSRSCPPLSLFFEFCPRQRSPAPPVWSGRRPCSACSLEQRSACYAPRTLCAAFRWQCRRVTWSPVTHGSTMLSVLLACAFLGRQLWGAVADRVGGLRAILAGSACQVTA